LVDLQRTVYPNKRSPVSWRPSAGQEQFAGEIPTFYHCATQPTIALTSRHECRHIADSKVLIFKETSLKTQSLTWHRSPSEGKSILISYMYARF